MKVNVSLLDKFISKNLNIFLKYNFNGNLYLTGGTIRDLLFLNKMPKDIDFVLLSQKKITLKILLKSIN